MMGNSINIQISVDIIKYSQWHGNCDQVKCYLGIVFYRVCSGYPVPHLSHCQESQIITLNYEKFCMNFAFFFDHPPYSPLKNLANVRPVLQCVLNRPFSQTACDTAKVHRVADTVCQSAELIWISFLLTSIAKPVSNFGTAVNIKLFLHPKEPMLYMKDNSSSR